ncbi:MAG: Mth938-like domain-containing protein [Tepidimonas ignava]|uniref:Mth938-like domain-containing protein n=1 Tax=Tepidimonas ignava TaxID=114249 RepID=UPI002A2C9A16|nr:Mth938-like domain-containing protein [Tepidimonas ignava]
MKIQPDRIDTLAIQAHGPGWLHAGGQRYEHSVVIAASGVLRAWDCARFEALTVEHFAQLAELAPEVVLFGSGPRLRFVPPALLRPLIERGIGVETMDTMAAARTYNILAGEGRRVVAALLIEPGHG